MQSHRSALDQFFEKNGYIVVRGVITQEEVRDLRSLLEEVFARTASGPERIPKRLLLPSEVLKISEASSLVFRQAIVSALREILGETFTVFADLMIHRNMFGPRRRWHTDSGSEGRNAYLFSPVYRFVKCGIFLQDNNPEWGGGIDVIPGAHRFPILTQNNNLNFRVKNLTNRIEQRFRGQTLNIKAGDFVAFDSRLPHSSTWPSGLLNPDMENDHVRNIPKDKTKFVIYWNSCRNHCVDDFMENSGKRAEHEEIETRHPELFFCDYLRLKFPESYPADFAAAANRAGVAVASLDEASALEWNRKYEAARGSAK